MDYFFVCMISICHYVFVFLIPYYYFSVICCSVLASFASEALSSVSCARHLRCREFLPAYPLRLHLFLLAVSCARHLRCRVIRFHLPPISFPLVFHLSPSDAHRLLIGCSSDALYDVTLTSTAHHPFLSSLNSCFI